MVRVSSGYPQVILGSSSRVWHDSVGSGKGDRNLKKSHKWAKRKRCFMTNDILIHCRCSFATSDAVAFRSCFRGVFVVTVWKKSTSTSCVFVRKVVILQVVCSCIDKVRHVKCKQIG